jgi:hypothetical protein
LVSEATSHSFELPEPGLVDVDSLIGTNSGPQVAAVVAQFLSALKLSTFGPTGQSIIKAELTALVESLNAEDPSNSALTRYSDAMEKLHLKLPAADYANLMMAIQEQVSALLVNTLRP